MGYTDERSGYDGSIRVFAEPPRRNGSRKEVLELDCWANTIAHSTRSPETKTQFLKARTYPSEQDAHTPFWVWLVSQAGSWQRKKPSPYALMLNALLRQLIANGLSHVQKLRGTGHQLSILPLAGRESDWESQQFYPDLYSEYLR